MTANHARESLLGGARAALYFYEGQYLFRTKVKRGERATYLSPADVRAAFTEERLDTGWIAESIVRCGTTADGPFAAAFFPAERHTIALVAEDGSLEPLTVPVPPLVVFGHKSYSVWAVASPTFDPNARVFHAPFPNVFTSGQICFGSNTPPRFSYGALRAARALFLDTPFNGNEAANRSKAHPRDVRAQLRELAAHGAEAYPVGDLVPATGAPTVGGRIDAILDKRGAA